MTDQPTGDPIGETTPETARTLLWRHGLPEDVIDGALALFAQELAGKIRAHRGHTRGAVQATKVMDFAADLISPEHWARTVPAVPVSSPPPDQTALRDILRAVLNTFPTNLNPAGPAVQGRHVPVELLERWRRYAEAEQPAAVPPTADRAAVLREAAEVVHETTAPASWTADSISCWNTATNIAESKLRRLAAEAQPPCAECGHAYADHEEGEDPVSPGRCRACEDDFGWHNYQPTQAQQPGAETEAHPPTHAWRVETRDPDANQWTPGSHFAHRPAAVERWETANRTAPLWNDGTPVERRIVRETTTYTVDQPATTDGNADDCPACQAQGLHTIGHPYECPGSETAGEAPAPSNSGPGWYEVINPRNATTNIAYVHEDGSLYLPEGDDLTPDEFAFAAARGNAHRLVRADEETDRG